MQQLLQQLLTAMREGSYRDRLGRSNKEGEKASARPNQGGLGEDDTGRELGTEKPKAQADTPSSD